MASHRTDTDHVQSIRDGLLDTQHALEYPKIKALFQRNATDSPLLRLPGEIRNRIYTFLMTQPVEIYIYCPKNPRVPTYVERTSHGFTSQPTSHGFLLPRVCRQLYTETSGLLYKTARVTAFVVPGMEGTKSLLPAQLKLISAVHLSYFSRALTYPESLPGTWCDDIKWVAQGVKKLFPEVKKVMIPGSREEYSDKAFAICQDLFETVTTEK